MCYSWIYTWQIHDISHHLLHKQIMRRNVCVTHVYTHDQHIMPHIMYCTNISCITPYIHEQDIMYHHIRDQCVGHIMICVGHEQDWSWARCVGHEQDVCGDTWCLAHDQHIHDQHIMYHVLHTWPTHHVSCTTHMTNTSCIMYYTNISCIAPCIHDHYIWYSGQRHHIVGSNII